MLTRAGLAMLGMAVVLTMAGCGSDDGSPGDDAAALSAADGEPAIEANSDQDNDAEAASTPNTADTSAGDTLDGDAAIEADSSQDIDAGDTGSAPALDSGPDADGELFPDVMEAEASQAADGTWGFDVTLSSPYDSPERYADAWRILDPDGNELGIRVLTHHHATEQPFTRSLSGVEIPEDITTVTVQGRDQVSGWGGATVDVQLER